MAAAQNDEQRRAAPARERATVAVVGAGASGTLVAAQLLREASLRAVALRVVLIDRREHGAGVAYSTVDPQHLLNVPVSGMSALPDACGHFRDWRERTSGDGAAQAFAPRAEYRRYLRDVLDAARREAAPGVTLAALVADVIDVDPLPDRVRLRFADGGTLDAELAVLALGNGAGVAPAAADAVLDHPAYVNDPWARGALDELEPGRCSRALLIGTGLSMVDVALTIASRHPGARILAVSRHGLLPRGHPAVCDATQLPAASAQDGASLAERVDAVLAASAAGDPRWHRMVDELRPAVAELWCRMSLEQRAEFLATRHRAWSVHRHRMAPAVAAAIADLQAAGALRCRGGAVRLAPAPGGSIEARLAEGECVRVEIAVNCTGPGLDPRTSADPLVRALLAAGHVRAHPLGVGFDTEREGAFRTRGGSVQARLFTLGPPRMGELYETVAVPEIRFQALELARALVAALRLAQLDARTA